MSAYVRKIKETISSGDVCVVNFSASWCGPCKSIAPRVVKLAEDNPTIHIFKVDVDQQEDYADEHNVSSVPTFLVYSQKKLTKRINGANIQQLESAVRSAVQSVVPASGTVSVVGK